MNDLTSNTQAAIVSRALADQAEQVAIALWGEPTSRSRREWRFGRRGSKSLCVGGPKRGHNYDHEVGQGGDMLDLVARELNVPLGKAIEIAERNFLSGFAATPAVRRPAVLNHLMLMRKRA
jgi:putative DNA primase/helicase